MLLPPFAEWTEAVLTEVDLMKGLPVEALLDLGERARWERRAANDLLIRAERRLTALLILVRGRVVVERDGGETKETLEAGATLGLVEVLRKQPAAFAAVAAVPSLVAWLDRDVLVAAVRRYPTLTQAIEHADSAARDPSGFDPCIDVRLAEALIVAGGRFARPDGWAALAEAPDHALWASLLRVSEFRVLHGLARLRAAGLCRALPRGRLALDLNGLRRYASRARR
ncbi:MAG: cyclic nucleotide-binding domain-containing protein [Pseudomonadota bacterium]